MTWLRDNNTHCGNSQSELKQCFCIGPQGINTKCPCELERESYKKQCDVGDMLNSALRESATKISKGRRAGDNNDY